MEEKSVGGRKFLLLSWQDIERQIDVLAEEIAGDTYPVDTIVGILRGGVVVADLLSDVLDIREIYVIGCQSYKGTKSGELKIYHDLILKDLRGRNVLLVDDVADTGSTLEAAVAQIIKPRQPREVRTATLLKKPWSSYVPDYCSSSTDAWIIFPWERFETIRSVGKIFVESLGPEKAVEQLTIFSRLNRKKIASVLEFPQRTY